MLKVGDFVVIKNKYIKNAPSYQKSGIYIIVRAYDNFVVLEDYYEHFFEFNELSRPEWIQAKKCQISKVNFKQEKTVCNICKKEKHEYEILRYKNKNICSECLKVKRYATRNNKKVFSYSKFNKRFGIEFECIPKDRNSYIEIILNNPYIIPTHDGSLPTNGIEFKTPIVDRIETIEKYLYNIESNAILTDSSCGQHINISDSRMTKYEYEEIRIKSKRLFTRLLNYMAIHPFSTKKIWGRYFTHFANCDDNYCHGSWLNLQKPDVIEWRLPKYKNHKQYMNLIEIISGIDDIIYDNYISKIYENDGKENKLAKKCSEKIVKFYKSYVKKERINRFLSLFRI